MDRHISRSPSPNPQTLDGSSRPTTPNPYARPASAHDVTWASAQARSAQVHGHSGSSNRLGALLQRRVADPVRAWLDDDGERFAVKEKSGRGRRRYKAWLRRAVALGARLRLRNVLLFVGALLFYVFFSQPIRYRWRRTSWLGGGSKFVIILAANQGGGVMEWKGPREWAIERDSVRNKKRYAARWGYELEIVDMSTKKRYAHEWRESWEKVDTVRNTMRKYPEAEWFWWLDLNTFIMEPSYSLQSHVFNHLDRGIYRDINDYNPLHITHPPNATYLDEESRSPVGDGKTSSINMIIPQDCSGFNLGSFFVRRSAWTDRLLDIWWDPVGYEQKHMEWEHKEQDALEAMYRNQPWVRNKFAFIHSRKINSFPPGACGETGDDPFIHYQEADRDFLVNMAGCEWGRDCWGEIYHYRELSNKLNRTLWEKFKDGLSDRWKSLLGKDKPKAT